MRMWREEREEERRERNETEQMVLGSGEGIN